LQTEKDSYCTKIKPCAIKVLLPSLTEWSIYWDSVRGQNHRDDERCQRVSPQATPSYSEKHFITPFSEKQENFILSLYSMMHRFLNYTMFLFFVCIFFSFVFFGKIIKKHFAWRNSPPAAVSLATDYLAAAVRSPGGFLLYKKRNFL
jgi:hypothetical protein